MGKYMQDTVMLGADFYETDVEVTTLLAEGRVPIGVGENTKIKYKLFYLSFISSQSFIPHCKMYNNVLLICRDCIIDKNARIGKNVVIANSEVQTSYTFCS